MGQNYNEIEDIKKTGEKAIKAGIWYVFSSIIVKSISIITTPLFTRLLTPEQYGTVQTFISWQSLLLPIFSLNLPYSLGRAKLDFGNDLDKFLGCMQLLSALVSTVLVAFSLLLINPVSDFLSLEPLETVMLLLYLLFTPSILLYQGIYKFRYKYRQNIAIAWYMAGFTTLLSLLLIWFSSNPNKSLMRIIGLVAPSVILALFLWYKSASKKLISINKKYWNYALKLSVPLIFHMISIHILSQSDRIFITKIWGKTDTALYSLAYTFGASFHIITNAIAEGWLPWFHDNYFAGNNDAIRKNVKPLVVLGCYMGLACVTLGPEAIYILGGSSYSHAVECIPPVVLGIVCQYIYTHYVNIELHLKKTIYVSIGTIIASLFNIVTNAIFIPLYGFVAAAYTTLASYLLLLFIHTIITKKILHVKLYNDFFMYGSMLITACVAYLISLTYTHNLIRYIILCIGFISFIFVYRDYFKKWIQKRKHKNI